MNENRSQDRREPLAAPLTLRSGITLANRLAKAATSEHLADRRGAPTNQLVTAYRALAQSGAGLLISGNVMVDGTSLEAPRNVVIEDDSHNEELRRWAASTEGTEAKLILQLSHPGRQTMRGNVLPGRRQDVVGPSPVPLTVGGNRLFRPPRALSDAEITVIIGRFARAAQIAADTGFHGVQIHAAHGYLFNQFLSPLVNQRTDRWGGSLENRMRLLVETVRAIRAATPDEFLVAVKLNSADFQRGGFDSDDSLTVARALDEGRHRLPGDLRRNLREHRHGHRYPAAGVDPRTRGVLPGVRGAIRPGGIGAADADGRIPHPQEHERGVGQRCSRHRRTGTPHHLRAGPSTTPPRRNR